MSLIMVASQLNIMIPIEAKFYDAQGMNLFCKK